MSEDRLSKSGLWMVRYHYNGSPEYSPAWFSFTGTQAEFFAMLAEHMTSREIFEMHIRGPRYFERKPLAEIKA